MRRQLVRVSLVIIALVIVSTSLYRVFLIEQQIVGDRDTESEFSVSAWELGLALGDLRAAQQAYVAAGQDRAYWVEKVALHFTRIATELTHLADLSTTSAGSNAIAEVESAVKRLDQLDVLAREYSSLGQNLMASDLIFADGLEIATAATRHLEIARNGELDAQNLQRRQLRRREAIALGAAMGTGLLVMFLLLPVARIETARVRGEQPEPATMSPPAEGVEGASSPAEAETGRPNDGTGHGASDSARSQDSIDGSDARTLEPNLRQAADLCTDLGQLLNTNELPDALKRAAELLHASGIILWVRDESGVALRPAAGHGYSPDMLLKIGTISCDGDNVTIEAYRSGQLQVVSGTTDETGAIAAPLLAPSGCIGVMSAEICEANVMSEILQATTLILAAQLSTLVSADPVAETGRAQA